MIKIVVLPEEILSFSSEKVTRSVISDSILSELCSQEASGRHFLPVFQHWWMVDSVLS
jgi:hypothetical protein